MIVFAKKLARIVLTSLLILGSSAISADSSENAVVVINSQVDKPHIPLGAVRSIFGMRLRTWNDGTPIKVFVLPDDHPTHIRFAKKLLGMFPHQLRWAWDRLVFSGTGQAPVTVQTEEEMRENIASTPGAIGYLSSGFIDGEVHVLQIQ